MHAQNSTGYATNGLHGPPTSLSDSSESNCFLIFGSSICGNSNPGKSVKTLSMREKQEGMGERQSFFQGQQEAWVKSSHFTRDDVLILGEPGYSYTTIVILLLYNHPIFWKKSLSQIERFKYEQ